MENNEEAKEGGAIFCPGIIGDVSGSRTPRKHTKPPRVCNEKAECRRRAYKEITHLGSGCLLGKVEKLRRERPRRSQAVSGSRHYHTKRRKIREDTKRAYYLWQWHIKREMGSPSPVEYRDWWILKFTHPRYLKMSGYKKSVLKLFRYDKGKHYTLSNLFMGYISKAGPIKLADATEYLREYLSDS